MSRRDPKIADYPFGTWVAEVDANNRVRLPLKIAAAVRWINPESSPIECVGMPGPWGGIQLAPLTDHERDVQRLVEAMADRPPSISESPQKWVDLARYLATAWLIPLSVEANRISITLPEPLRRSQQVPQAGGTVVVFGFGDILEIWDALKWHEHVRATAKRRAAAISEALEDLEQRS